MHGRIVREGGRAHLAGGDVGESARAALAVKEQRGQVVRLALREHGAFDDRSGGDDADHVPLYDALRQPRILQLLAHGDLVALLDQPGDVLLRGVIGHAAHGRPLILGPAPVTGGQRQLQLLRSDHGVFIEHFVEVAQAEKQQAVGMLSLDGVILGFHGGGFRRHSRILPVKSCKAAAAAGIGTRGHARSVPRAGTVTPKQSTSQSERFISASRDSPPSRRRQPSTSSPKESGSYSPPLRQG